MAFPIQVFSPPGLHMLAPMEEQFGIKRKESTGLPTEGRYKTQHEYSTDTWEGTSKPFSHCETKGKACQATLQLKTSTVSNKHHF